MNTIYTETYSRTSFVLCSFVIVLTDHVVHVAALDLNQCRLSFCTVVAVYFITFFTLIYRDHVIFRFDNSLPDDRIFASSKLKAIAEDTLNIAQIRQIVQFFFYGVKKLWVRRKSFSPAYVFYPVKDKTHNIARYVACNLLNFDLSKLVFYRKQLTV